MLSHYVFSSHAEIALQDRFFGSVSLLLALSLSVSLSRFLLSTRTLSVPRLQTLRRNQTVDLEQGNTLVRQTT